MLGGPHCKGSSWKSRVWKAWAWPPARPAQLPPRKRTRKRGAQRPLESLGHLQMQPCSGVRTPKPGSLQETPPRLWRLEELGLPQPTFGVGVSRAAQAMGMLAKAKVRGAVPPAQPAP